ncbi:hypothetical protein RFI_34229 [Reticulomyxa filosa]|uniref:Kelch motif family protein n=1 Tax=Reticulomyxa filosa TaxID=46433 RepID=X6LP65_RETFI|nr:hypothetical protein RFI_34229 [Reticulomyxa filosa]|eukprot:ETO03181.1 hypothetical protein RFI_34229 [Reticulomyxa filosa]
MKKTNVKINEMLLFCENTGLLVIYDEDANAFQFQKLRICTNFRSYYSYGFIYVDDCILFFGGENGYRITASKEIHKYSIKENKWMKFEQSLPIALADCATVLSSDNKFVHILGGNDGNNTKTTHIKTNVKEWTKEEITITEKQWIMEEGERIHIEETKDELKRMQEDVNFNNLKVTLKHQNAVSLANIQIWN